MSDIQALQNAYTLLHSPEHYKDGLEIVCKIADQNPSDLRVRQLLYDCFISSRIYGYLDIAEKHNVNFSDGIHASDLDFIPLGIYGSEYTNSILTKDQKIAFDAFQKARRLCVSAPTSFGKTFLLFEILVANGDRYNNILIVVPTIALSIEIYYKLRSNPYLADYELINNTRIPIDRSDKHIFLFTPEKTDIFLDENPDIKIDFFAMDEVYKIAFDEGRKEYFDYCLYKLLNKGGDAYLIGPYIEEFDSKLREKYGIDFLKFSNEIVVKNIEKKGGSKPKKSKLLEIINNKREEQFIVYHGYQKGPNENTALYLAENLNFNGPNDLADFLQENYHKEWGLITCLRKGVAFHHSGIPRYVQKEIMDRFNKGEIKVLVATSTIIEGVNTTAKNVILYDDKKASQQISQFDRKNIVGRAGRFGEHFMGYCFDLNKEDLIPDLGEDHIISEYSTLENLRDDKLLLVDSVDIENENLQKKLDELILSLKEIYPGLPEVLRKNKFVDRNKQICLLHRIVSDVDAGKNMEFSGFHGDWTNNLRYIYRLIEECGFFPLDNRNQNPWPFYVYVPWTVNYIISGEKQFIDAFIKHSQKMNFSDSSGEKINHAIRDAFKTISTLFGFLLPKYLKVFENIYNLVAINKGFNPIDLDFLISKIEFGYQDEHEILLSSLGIPQIIIEKISKHFKGCSDLKEITEVLKRNSNFVELGDFEKYLLKKLIF